MAVAGLHNVSGFGPSFFGESQTGVSRPSNQASSLLQMWRELEGEHVVSCQSYRSRQQRNSSDSECQSTSTSLGHGSDNGDNLSQDSENQGFSGSEADYDDNNSIISEQSSDLGEIERERVRQIFREWMNNGSKGHSSYGCRVNNRSGQWLGENERERVRIIRERAQMTTHQRNNRRSSRDGVAEVGSQTELVHDGLVITHTQIGARRPIRRLCGRQTLLDLLLRAQNERERELLSLSEQRPVSNFTHRNRIQALLRGRFLQKERSVLNERPSSVAATELGLLWQRHTVSDLREGFLSKLENCASSTSANSFSESESSFRDGNNGELESSFREGEVAGIHTAPDSESGSDRNRNTQELEIRMTEAEHHILVNAGNDEARQHELFTNVEYYGTRHGEQINANVINDSSSESADANYIGSHDENYESRSGVSYDHEVDHHTTDSERQMIQEFDSRDSSALLEEFQESVTEIENDGGWRERASNQSFLEQADNNVEEQYQMQESHDWPSHDLQEAIDSWLDMPSTEVDTYYFPDDDNVQNMEIRELFSRRRVSSLLRSSFRQSLDQVLQSHVERLVHASDVSELDNNSELDGDQASVRSGSIERNPFTQSSTLFDASQTVWDEGLPSANWPHLSSNQHMKTEWEEMVDGLRIEMARLQLRMNNMQSMLEACMDMQIELQRSVRQEVSAALNRPTFSADVSEDNRLHDECQWDYVRKGICCLCRDSKIDSLLYRCGHMCTCAKCAENLVECRGKCPMCWAPAIEVVRAYFNQ